MKPTGTTVLGDGAALRHFRSDSPAPQVCPSCGETLDATTTTGKRGPKEGDISICVGCGTLLCFEDADYFRTLEDAELQKLALHMPTVYERVTTIQARIRAR